jgi:tight adherence protein B
MGALLGLTFALGIILILHSGTVSPDSGTSATQKWTARRNELLHQAGINGVTSTHLLVLQIITAFIAAIPLWILSKSLSVAGCFLVFGFFAPMVLVRGSRRRRIRELRDMWPDVVDNLASAVRAGMALPEAVGGLATRGPESLRPAFARFAADYRVSGRFGDCLDQLKVDLADPVGDRVCESLRLAHEVGGNDLGRLLRTLSVFLREDSRTRGELETRQGWTINAARLAVASPWLVLLLLTTQSSTLEAFDSSVGRALLVGGAVLSVLAYRLMMRIGRLPEEQRVLR